MLKLTISILVHEDFTYIGDALQNIHDHTRTEHITYVVINQGSPEKIAKLKQSFPHLNYIINQKPQGFAANHNMVMSLAKTPYIALLNDDIAFSDPVLDQLVDYLDDNQLVGVVGPQLQYADGTLQVTAYSDPNVIRMIYKISGLGRFTHQRSFVRKLLMQFGLARVSSASSLQAFTETRDVEVLKAAAIIVRKATVDDVGLIDETTKAYGEEIDWNLRMRLKGWRAVLIPEARITHFGVGQAMMQLQGWQLVEDRKAILNYFLKHKPFWQSGVIRTAIVILHSLQLIGALVFSRKNVSSHLQTVKLGLSWKRPQE